MREDYERAVSLARAAIEEHKARRHNRLDRPSPQALVARIQERQARGEDTETDLARLAAALAERRPGRPRGTRNVAAHGAFRAALFAVDGTDLPTYRNPYSPHRFSQCDAIAAAMQAAGFRNVATYDAAGAAMKAAKRDMKAASRQLSRIVRPLDRLLRDMTCGIAPALARWQAQQAELARTLGAVARHIQADPALMEELVAAREKRALSNR